MKSFKTYLFSDFFPLDSSTMRVLRKSEKVKNIIPVKLHVELCRNCGVERENFLKIWWKTFRQHPHFSHSVELHIFEKVEIQFYCRKFYGVCEESFQLSFQHCVETSVESC